jgi:hypothetical protein
VKILTLDPGGGTGYAVWSGSLEKPWNPDDVVMGVIEGRDHHLKLEEFLTAELTILDTDSPDNTLYIDGAQALPVKSKRVAVSDSRLIYEGFDHTDNRSAELVSLEYIGVAKLFAQRYGIKHFRASRSSKDVAYLKGRNLKDFGLWPDSKDAKDAARHLVWHMVFVLNFHDMLYYRERSRSGI